MARNKLANQAHGQRAARRDMRREEYGDDAGRGRRRPGRHPEPSAAARELLDEARARLTADELGCLRCGKTASDWAEIAAAEGANPDALRKKLPAPSSGSPARSGWTSRTMADVNDPGRQPEAGRRRSTHCWSTSGGVAGRRALPRRGTTSNDTPASATTRKGFST